MRYRSFLLIALLLGMLLGACSKPATYRPPDVPISREIAPLPPVKAPEAEAKLPKPFKKTLVVVDAGHGGEDFGTHSNDKPRYQEKHLNLSTAKILRSYLEQMGYLVAMTRTEDVFVSLDDRAKFSNMRKPALFVSVHYNSAPNEAAHGIEVYYYNSETDKKRAATSKIAAQEVLDKVLKNTGAKSRGVKHGNYLVIRNTTTPAILIEGGFMTNATEVAKLKDPGYVKRLAWGAAQGVDAYIKKGAT